VSVFWIFPPVVFQDHSATRGRGVVLCLRHGEHPEQVLFGL